MPISEFKTVLEAVKLNISLLRESNGEALIVGLEGFSEPMLNLFDDLYDLEAARLFS